VKLLWCEVSLYTQFVLAQLEFVITKIWNFIYWLFHSMFWIRHWRAYLYIIHDQYSSDAVCISWLCSKHSTKIWTVSLQNAKNTKSNLMPE
jgi:hypothetical protein